MIGEHLQSSIRTAPSEHSTLIKQIGCHMPPCLGQTLYGVGEGNSEKKKM